MALKPDSPFDNDRASRAKPRVGAPLTIEKSTDELLKEGEEILRGSGRQGTDGQQVGRRGPKKQRSYKETTGADIGSPEASTNFGTNSGIIKLYQKIYGKQTTQEDELDNPLDDYTNVTYGASLSLVDCGPGNGLTYDELISKNKWTFASSGSIEDTFDSMYGISDISVKTVCSVSAANPELAFTHEIKIELNEPFGLSFDRNIREIGKNYSYGNSNPATYVWRLDIWWNGYDSSGKWHYRIPFNGFRKEKIDLITHFISIISVETTVSAEGSKYSLDAVPVKIAIPTREENIITDQIEIVLPDPNNKLGVALDRLSEILTERSKTKKENHTYEIKYPEEIKETFLTPIISKDESINQATKYINYMKKVTLSSPPGSSILTFIQNIIAASPEIRAVGADADKMGGIENAPNMSFVINTDVDYTTATYDEEKNTYTGIKFIYEVTPYLEWKSAKPYKNIDGRVNQYGIKHVRRVYDYTWSGLNTEVISMDAKLRLFYYIDDGYGKLNEEPMASTQTTVGPNKTSPNDVKQNQQRTKDEHENGKKPEYTGYEDYGQGRVGNETFENEVPNGNPTDNPRGDNRSYSETSPYGPRRRVATSQGSSSKNHRGDDIGTPVGTPIYATSDGIVDVRTGGAGGRQIAISNSRYITRYLHLDRFAPGITNGKRVRKGDLIGYSGNTGNTSGPHLHYEVIQRDPKTGKLTWKNPDDYGSIQNNERKSKWNGGPSGGDEEEGSTGKNTGEPKYGRTITFQPIDNTVGVQTKGDRVTEQYQLAFERRIGPDLVTLEGLTVRGDPRWLLSVDQIFEYRELSSVIKMNVYVTNQEDYMSQNAGRRTNDLSLSGYYEIIQIDHNFRDGIFQQVLSGYRILGLNPT